MNAILDKSAVRAVEHVSVSQMAPVGTFTVRRALPFRERHSVGPWVFLDHFGPFRVKPGEDGVGPHPHAGREPDSRNTSNLRIGLSVTRYFQASTWENTS